MNFSDIRFSEICLMSDIAHAISKASYGNTKSGLCYARDTINISVRIIGRPRSMLDLRKSRELSCLSSWSWQDYSRPLRGKPGIRTCPGFQRGRSTCRTRLTTSCFRISVIGKSLSRGIDRELITRFLKIEEP